MSETGYSSDPERARTLSGKETQKVRHLIIFLVPLAFTTLGISQANALLKHLEPTPRVGYLTNVDSNKIADGEINVKDLISYIRISIKQNKKIDKIDFEPVIWRFIPQNSFYNRVYKQVVNVFYDNPSAFFQNPIMIIATKVIFQNQIT